MRLRISKIAVAAMTLLPVVAPDFASARSFGPRTVNGQGEAGATDYSGFPFGSSIYNNSWGSINSLPNNSGLLPGNLFWQSGSFFTNPGYMANAQSSAASLASQGIVPVSASQRWEDTFEASQPASNFGTEPSWIVTDRNNNGNPLPNLPENQAWVAWMKARPGLNAMANDGGSLGQDFRAWRGTWGHVSPMMPLASSDCPPDLSSCTFGDWFAYRWAQTSKLSGAYGIILSDFTASLPGQPSWAMDFAPALVSAFEAQKGVNVPGNGTAAQSAYITANLLPQWNDFIAGGYAKYFNALATRITASTGQQALVVAGGFDWPGLNRNYGVDERLMHQQPGLSRHLLVVWDSITLETDRTGKSIVWGIGGPVISAAREPGVRNGAYLSANDSNFWAAVAQFNPTLSQADQQEWGLKQLKREWLEFAWAHVGSRQGDTRRALAYSLRDHWDAGTLDATTTSLIQTINPKRPFGFGLYYSGAVERALEPTVPQTLGAYLSPDDLLALRQTVPLNYYVSDVSLPKLKKTAAPAAWIVLDAGNHLPASELSALQKLAPVFTSAQQALAFTGAPLSFTNGLTGTGFYDQKGRIIVTVTSPSTAANAGTINGSIVLKGLPNGSHSIADLYSGNKQSFTVANGSATIPVSVARWDTMAFAITL